MNLEPAQPRENSSPQAPIPSPAISTCQELLRSLGNHIFFPEIVGNHSALNLEIQPVHSILTCLPKGKRRHCGESSGLTVRPKSESQSHHS